MSQLGVDSGGNLKLLPPYFMRGDLIFQRGKHVKTSSVSQYKYLCSAVTLAILPRSFQNFTCDLWFSEMLSFFFFSSYYNRTVGEDTQECLFKPNVPDFNLNTLLNIL